MQVCQGKVQASYVLDDRPIAQGGEGAIYTIQGESALVAKVFLQDPEIRERKILRMMSVPPDGRENFSWPCDALYNKGSFVGFVMPKVSGKVKLIDAYTYDHRANVPWGFYITVARNLAYAVQAVHDAGHVVGDLNPNNILVDPNTAMVTIIDTDSFHITDVDGTLYRCGVGMPEFVAPELQGVDFAHDSAPTFTVDSDRFALAVLIFRILMNGAHPFSCKTISGSSSSFQPIDNIVKDICPYFDETTSSNLTIPPYSPTIDALPSYLSNLFRRVFVYAACSAVPKDMKSLFAGTANTSSTGRPSAKEWCDSLERLQGELVECEKVQNHQFYKGCSSCPWCAVDQAMESVSRNSQTFMPPTPMAMPQVGNGQTQYSNTAKPSSIYSQGVPSIFQRPKTQSSGGAKPSTVSSSSLSGQPSNIGSFYTAAQPQPQPQSQSSISSSSGLRNLASAIWNHKILIIILIAILAFVFNAASSMQEVRSFNDDRESILNSMGVDTNYTGEVFPAKAEQNGYWGLLGANQKWLIEPKYAALEPFCEGLAAAADSASGLYGFINRAGEWVVSPQFDDADGFYNGLAPVKTNGKWGYIDKSGSFVISPQFDNAGMFNESGTAIVVGRASNPFSSVGAIDTSGNWVISPDHLIEISSNGSVLAMAPFHDGYAAVQTANGWGFVDSSGNWSVIPAYESVGYFSDGVAPVEASDGWGYINAAGEAVVTPQYSYAASYEEGLAVVTTSSGTGYINSQGVVVIDCKFNDAGSFVDGLGVVQSADSPNGTYYEGIIDTSGSWVVDPVFYSITSPAVYFDKAIEV